MDVQCGVCGIEYEFDDALLSDRGTVVRCTSCGHQFRVFPPGNLGFTAQRWIVFTLRGERLEFSSLRELQHALSAGYLARSDELARGQGPRRPLGSIAELDGFFRDAPPQVPADGTLAGIAPPANPPAQPPPAYAPPILAASHAAPGGPTLRVPVAPHYEGRLLEHAPTRAPGAGLGMPGLSSRSEVAVTKPFGGNATFPEALSQDVSRVVLSSSRGDAPGMAKETLMSAMDSASDAGGVATPGVQPDALPPQMTLVSAPIADGACAPPGASPGSSGGGPVQAPAAQTLSVSVPMSRPSPRSAAASASAQSSGRPGSSAPGGAHRKTTVGESTVLLPVRLSPEPSLEGGRGGGSPDLRVTGAGGTLRLSDSPATGVGTPSSGLRSSVRSQESSRRSEGMPPRSDPTMRSEHGDGVGAVADEVSVSFVSPRDSDRVAAGASNLGWMGSRAAHSENRQDCAPRHRSESALALASAAVEPVPPGHRLMWLAVAGLLPLLATGGVFAWKYVRQARAQRQAATVVAVSSESSASPATALSLMDQGRFDEASAAIERAAGRPEEEWSGARMMLAVGRAELAHYRTPWEADQKRARIQAVRELEKAEEAVVIAAKAPSVGQGLEAARVRLAWIRSRSALPIEGHEGPSPSSLELTDRLAQVLVSQAQARSEPPEFAEQLGEVSRRELGFGPVRAATVAAWLEAGEVKAAIAVLDGVGVAYRDEVWRVAARFVSSQATVIDAGATVVAASAAASPAVGEIERAGPSSGHGKHAAARVEIASPSAVAALPPANPAPDVLAPEPEWDGVASGRAAPQLQAPAEPASTDSPRGVGPDEAPSAPASEVEVEVEVDPAPEGGS